MEINFDYTNNNELHNALNDLKNYQTQIAFLGGREECELVANKKKVFRCKEHLGYDIPQLMEINAQRCKILLEIEKETRRFIAHTISFESAILCNQSVMEDSETMTPDELAEKHFANVKKLADRYEEVIFAQLKETKVVNKYIKYKKAIMTSFGEKPTRTPNREQAQADNATGTMTDQQKTEIRKIRKEDFAKIGIKLLNWRIGKDYTRQRVSKKLGTSIDIIKKIEEGNEHAEAGIFFAYIKLSKIKINNDAE